MNQKGLIRSEEQYQLIKGYVEDWIGDLMTQRQIKRKDSLKIIKEDLSNLGYIPSGWKTKFFFRLFMYEKKHRDNLNSKDLVLDLKRFVRQYKEVSTGRLPGFHL